MGRECLTRMGGPMRYGRLIVIAVLILMLAPALARAAADSGTRPAAVQRS